MKMISQALLSNFFLNN